MLVTLNLLVVEHFCREQDYGDMACGRVLLQCRTELHSVHLRHHHVAHHDVGNVFDCHLQSFLSVGTLHDVVFVGEGGSDIFPDVNVVVDYQQLGLIDAGCVIGRADAMG